jgi:iron(III) transport system substrate-binding protein
VKRRTLALAATAAAVALLTSACGGDGGEPALDPDKLTVYSSQHENLTQAWVDAFTAETGVEVQVRYGKDASMGQQIVTEGAKSPADVFLTENSPAMTLVSDAGLFAPLEAATLAQVPSTLRPSDGTWTGAAARATVLVYNPSLLPEDQLPASLMDLADPAWKGRWGAGATGADFQAIVSAVLATQGEAKTAAWLDGLKANAKVYANNIATMKAVNAGEVPAGVIYHYYWYRDQAKTKEGSANTALHFFGEQDPGAFVSVSGAGVLASSKHAADAQQFVAFVTGPKGQKVLADSDAMEYPVGGGVAANPALRPLADLDPPAVDPASLNGPKVVELMTGSDIL